MIGRPRTPVPTCLLTKVNKLMTDGYLPAKGRPADPARSSATPVTMPVSIRRLLLSLLLIAAMAGCATSGARQAPATASMTGDAARPALAHDWVRSELYFGVGKANIDPSVAAIGETQWRAFLDAEVTPRFPDGLTVLDGYGQWMFRGNPEPNRLDAKVLVILHEDSPQRVADIEAIRLAWKQQHGHQSVLWVRQPAHVSF